MLYHRGILVRRSQLLSGNYPNIPSVNSYKMAGFIASALLLTEPGQHMFVNLTDKSSLKIAFVAYDPPDAWFYIELLPEKEMFAFANNFSVATPFVTMSYEIHVPMQTVEHKNTLQYQCILRRLILDIMQITPIITLTSNSNDEYIERILQYSYTTAFHMHQQSSATFELQFPDIVVDIYYPQTQDKSLLEYYVNLNTHVIITPVLTKSEGKNKKPYIALVYRKGSYLPLTVEEQKKLDVILQQFPIVFSRNEYK